MKTFHTEQDVETELLLYAPSQLYGGDMQLDRMKLLMEYLGNPQDDLKVIHVAGTSGKTSTTYYIRALLQASGLKTGLTISPHIATIRERIQINGELIEEDSFVDYFNEFYDGVQGFDPKPTFFELVTAFAYWVFKKEKVDYAIIETGLGGRLDATNVVERTDKVSIITPIGFDHTDILGNTLKSIAGEKAEIIQPGSKVFVSSQPAEVSEVLKSIAKDKSAEIEFVDVSDDSLTDLPSFQIQNFKLAFRVAKYVSARDDFTLTSEAQKTLYKTQVPGRWEVYRVNNKTILLDGAHNPQKLEGFFESFRKSSFFTKRIVVVASLSEAPDRKISDCVKIMTDNSPKVVFTSFTLQRDVLRRSMSLDSVSDIVDAEKLRGVVFEQDAKKALKMALEGDEEVVVVTGSLYLVALLRPSVLDMLSE